jgi:hypothetical protein
MMSLFSILVLLTTSAAAALMLIRSTRSRPPSPASPAVGPPPSPVPSFAPPAPPLLRVLSPVGGSYRSPVRVTYVLTDSTSDPASLGVRFSTDGGASFDRATEATPGSDGTSGLTTSPGGVTHAFLWDADADLGGQGATGALLEFTPADARVVLHPEGHGPGRAAQQPAPYPPPDSPGPPPR